MAGFLNYNQDRSSMLMAFFFTIAVVAYSIGLFLTGRPLHETASA